MKIHRIIGPPGTGKTTTIGHILKTKSDLLGVVALSFTRAARWALLSKEIKGKHLERDQVRTIHSMAFRSLGLKGQNMMLAGHIASFFRQKGFKYREDQHGGDAVDAAIGNRLEALIGLAIHVSPNYHNADPWRSVEQAICALHNPQNSQVFMQTQGVLKVAREYWDHQNALQRWDFNGVLLMAHMGAGLDIMGTDLILDEAQDLTPIMQSLLLPRWKHFNNIYVVGDDDQAIFDFAGADPEFLLLLNASTNKILRKSYRLPDKIHRLSQEYIEQNERRLSKEFRSNGKTGAIEHARHLPEALSTAQGDVMVLSRTRHTLNGITRTLSQMGVNYHKLGADPKTPPLVAERCCNVLWAARNPTVVTAAEWESAIYHARPELMRGLPPKSEVKQWVFRPIPRSEMKQEGAKELWRRLGNADHTAFRNAKQLAPWWPLWSGRSKAPSARVVVGTIHQAKGLEADTVILDTTVTPRVKKQLSTEAERRVWYVAMTRAKSRLTLIGSGNEELTTRAKRCM